MSDVYMTPNTAYKNLLHVQFRLCVNWLLTATFINKNSFTDIFNLFCALGMTLSICYINKQKRKNKGKELAAVVVHALYRQRL